MFSYMFVDFDSLLFLECYDVLGLVFIFVLSGLLVLLVLIAFAYKTRFTGFTSCYGLLRLVVLGGCCRC